MTIRARTLFSQEILDYPVRTSDCGTVRYVNLDNAATTPLFLAVQKAVKNFVRTYGSVHRGAGTKSIISTNLYKRSHEMIKRFVNARSDDYVLFTQNTTGAMNAAAYFFSFLEGKIAVSEIEHSSSWLPWIKAEGIKKAGSNQITIQNVEGLNESIQKIGSSQIVRYNVNDSFEFDLESIHDVFRKNRIKAFVLTASSNATGYCPDVRKIGKIVHEYGALFIVDACQFI